VPHLAYASLVEVPGTAVQRTRSEPARQATIVGTVRDATTLEPLEAVQLVVEGMNLAALSSSAGTFSLTVPDGTYAVIANRIGYQQGRLSVTVEGGATARADFALNPSALA